MRIRQLLDLLFEAPIEDYQLIGDFNRSSSFRKPADRRLVTNPVYVERIKSMFAKTDIDFRFYLVNNAEANRHTEVGMVDIAWIQANMPTTLEAINQKGGFGASSFNMIFSNNKGVEWRPMTGWIMAHRMAHVVLRPNRYAMSNKSPMDTISRELGQILHDIFNSYGMDIPQRGILDNKITQYFFTQIGTMKSARDNNLRNSYEFIYECFAQHLLKSRILFNPPPDNLIVGYSYGRPSTRRIYGEQDKYAVEDYLEYMATTLSQEFDRALHAGIGKVFVM